jgi:hypothetical protein
MPTTPIPLHRTNLVTPFLKLRDLLAVPVPVGRDDNDEPIYRTRVYIPPPGQFMQSSHQATGIILRLEHRPNGLFLAIGDTILYPIISQPMPISPKKNGNPVRYLIKDTTGHLVFDLYQSDIDGDEFLVGSRWEMARWLHVEGIYSSHHLTPSQQTERRLAKLFSPFPELRNRVLDPKNTIAQLMYLRPNISRRSWMSVILRAKYNIGWKQIETEVTAALKDWEASRKSRGCPKGEKPENFAYSLGAYNELRKEVIEREREMSIEPPLPMHSNGLEGLN